MQAKKSRRGHCLENKNVFHKSFELTKIRRFCIKWASASEHCAKGHTWQSKTLAAAGCVQARCALEQDVLLPPGIAECPLSLETPTLPSACHGCSWPGRVSQGCGSCASAFLCPCPHRWHPGALVARSELCPPQKWALVTPALAGLCLGPFGLVPQLLQKLHSTSAARAKSVPSL